MHRTARSYIVAVCFAAMATIVHADERKDIFLQRASVPVSDLDAALAFYVDTLGLTAGPVGESASETFRAMFYVGEGVASRFALLDAHDGQPRVIGLVEVDGLAVDAASNRVNAPALVFGVTDMNGIYARSRAAGYEVLVAPAPLLGFDGKAIGTEMALFDPDGNRVILFELNGP